MIYYLSGTGNSRYVASQLAHLLNDDITEMSTNDKKLVISDRIGIVLPVYAWGISPFVGSFLKFMSDEIKTVRSNNNTEIWAVLTCGDETAMAPEILKKCALKNGIKIKGIWSVIMPNNYVLLPGFNVDKEAVELEKLEAAPKRILTIAKAIEQGKNEIDVVRGRWPRIKSGLVYPLFKKWGIFPKKWQVGEGCISCGKCEIVCPVKNIKLEDGHPVWGEDCISCVGCYHICPTNSIAYGKMTEGKGQYYLGKRGETLKV